MSHHDEGARHCSINGLACCVHSVWGARFLLDRKPDITSDTCVRENIVVVGINAEVSPTTA